MWAAVWEVVQSYGWNSKMCMGARVCVCVRGGLCFRCGTVMQINDLLQCRAEQHNACTPVHHSTSPVPPLEAGCKKKKKIALAHSQGVESRGGEQRRCA